MWTCTVLLPKQFCCISCTWSSACITLVRRQNNMTFRRDNRMVAVTVYSDSYIACFANFCPHLLDENVDVIGT